MFTGCTHTMKKDEVSTLQVGSPLKGISPKTFAFKEFKDARGRDPYLMYSQHKLEQPATAFVATAIMKELERNGHTCIPYSPQPKADFIVEGSVFKCWILRSQGMSTTTLTANVGAKITVSPASAENRVMTKTYEGEYRSGGVAGVDWKWKDILNQALLNMLKEFSTDSDLVMFLEK